MHININPPKFDHAYINAGGIEPFLVVNLTGGHWLTIEKAEAVKLRAALDDLIAYEPTPAVAEAATDESVLCGEDHSDDDTVLSGEIPASDSDAAVVESSL